MRSTRAAGTPFFCIKIIHIIIIIQQCNYRHRYRHTALQNRDDNHKTFIQYDSRVYVNGHLFSFLFLFFFLLTFFRPLLKKYGAIFYFYRSTYGPKSVFCFFFFKRQINDDYKKLEKG